MRLFQLRTINFIIIFLLLHYIITNTARPADRLTQLPRSPWPWQGFLYLCGRFTRAINLLTLSPEIRCKSFMWHQDNHHKYGGIFFMDFRCFKRQKGNITCVVNCAAKKQKDYPSIVSITGIYNMVSKQDSCKRSASLYISQAGFNYSLLSFLM